MPQLTHSFSSATALLDYAIEKELESASFYEAIADRVARPVLRMQLLEFAAEERDHAAELQRIRDSKLPMLPKGECLESLGICRHVAPVTVTTSLDEKQLLELAMREEKAAFAMYFRLAEATKDEALRLTLLALAEEEAKHKLRFELEYDAYLFEHHQNHQQKG